MNGTVIAASRNLGVVVIQTEGHGCVVLEVKGLMANPLHIGDAIDGQWDEAGNATLIHGESGNTFDAHVQAEGISRSEAIGTMSII